MNILEIMLFDDLGFRIHTFWAFRFDLEYSHEKIVHLGFISLCIRWK